MSDMDTKAVAEELQKMMEANKPAEQPKQMTEDELKEYLQVYEPDESFVNSFATAITDEEATVEDRQKALVGLRDGFVNQATRAAELMMEERIKELEARVAPATSYASQQQAEALWDDFKGTYPQLETHQQMVDMVSTSLVTSGYKPKDKDELFSKVAEGVEGILQKMDPNFKIGEAKSVAPSKMPSMAKSSSPPNGEVASPSIASNEDMMDVFD